MTEKVTPIQLNVSEAQLVPSGEAATAFNAEREQFALSLVGNGLISESFYTSGVLGEFGYDQETGDDSLIHLLVGNALGGGHHLPTMVSLAGGERLVASRIEDPKKSRRDLKQTQRIKGNGTFRALDVTIHCPDGQILEKDGGSTMFPSEWSAQQILEAVLGVKNQPGGDPVDRVSVHIGEVDGVRIKVITELETDKIISAYPK